MQERMTNAARVRKRTHFFRSALYEQKQGKAIYFEFICIFDHDGSKTYRPAGMESFGGGGYGDPLLDFRIMEHMSLLAPNPFLRHILHIDRAMLRRFYESFKNSISAKTGIRPN